METSNNPTFVFIAGEIEVDTFFGNFPKDLKRSYEHWDYYVTPRLWIIHTGIGAINAACAAYSFIKAFGPRGCVQIGFSGSHIPSLQIGDILLGKQVKSFSRHTKTAEGKIIPRPNIIQQNQVSVFQEQFLADSNLLKIVEHLLSVEQLPFQHAVVGGADQFNRDVEFIKKIQKAFGTWCEDMESAAVAQIAFQWTTPYLCLRIISNNEFTEDGKSQEGGIFQKVAFETLSQVGQVFLSHFPLHWS